MKRHMTYVLYFEYLIEFYFKTLLENIPTSLVNMLIKWKQFYLKSTSKFNLNYLKLSLYFKASTI